MAQPRYREETAAPNAHGSRARAFGAIERDVVALEGREAHEVPYTPANPADWTGTPPTTEGEALDRIAAALGPI